VKSSGEELQHGIVGIIQDSKFSNNKEIPSKE
jgi:hypothetical protein